MCRGSAKLSALKKMCPSRKYILGFPKSINLSGKIRNYELISPNVKC